jgi:hypothetical protein
MGGIPREARRHEHCVGVDGKVHERALLELEDGLVWFSVLLVLPPSVLNGLRSHLVLQLKRSDGDTVYGERDVKRLLRARREAELAGQAKTILGVTLLKFWIQFVRGLEIGDEERAPVELEAVAQCRQ